MKPFLTTPQSASQTAPLTRGAETDFFDRLKPPLKKRGLLPLILFLGFKGVFAEAADGAYPILGYILPSSAWSDAVFLIAYFGVIYITAGTNIFHYDNLHSAAEFNSKAKACGGAQTLT